MEILVDYRENDLYNILNELNINNYKIEKTNLEIGDIIIKLNNVNLLFERKTLTDLYASIKDGRYKEQKIRMLNNYNIKYCTYIIEENNLRENDKYVTDSSIIHSMYRDGIRILCVNRIKDTANWILKIATRVLKNPQNFINSNTEDNISPSYIECTKIKSKKIDNIDKHICYLLQLSQIPGVSHVIAEEIVKIYPTMKDFYMNDVTVEKLKNIPLIGEKKAHTIYKYMFE